MNETNTGNGALVDVSGVEKVFHRGSEDIQVLKDLHLQVPAGEFLALMGPSGSGKSTLLNLIGGLDHPTRGSVTVAGERIDQLSDRRLAAWRARHVGFVFQLYNLLPVLTAERNVELPLLLTRLSKSERRRHVETALEAVGLTNRAKHYPRQLSGGEQQRVGIARGVGVLASQRGEDTDTNRWGARDGRIRNNGGGCQGDCGAGHEQAPAGNRETHDGASCQSRTKP